MILASIGSPSQSPSQEKPSATRVTVRSRDGGEDHQRYPASNGIKIIGRAATST